MTIRQFLFFCFILGWITEIQAQLGTWNILHIRYVPHERLIILGEAQLRSLRFYDHFHYYEFKGGVSWRLNTQFSITAGVGRYDTYMAGETFKTPRQQKEIRTWAELGVRNSILDLSLEHRYRAEQRFTSNGYKNRFRYRLSSSIPFLKKAKYDLFGSIWNEVFLTDQAPYFERNRFFTGFILRRGNNAWHTGWVRQFDYRLTDEIGRSFFQIGWQISITRKINLLPEPAIQEN